MASLTDLFNPTFLMFLGILVLVVALVVVYFESKFREQNHKIASMFSIVSTLAEDANGMKMGINQLMHYSNTNGGSVQVQQQPFVPYEQNTKLIEVSDDEEESDDDSEAEDINSDVEDVEEDSESDVEDVEEDDSSLGKYMDDMESEPDSLSESDLEHVEQEKITVFKLKEDGDENVEDESIDELASELSDGDLGDIENVENLEEIKEEPVLDVSELKTISINLEEPVEKIDYKKLQLPKLKSVVVEKGLATSSDASKLKKAELLKLLGIE
jgi:hypothetical protein